jgi:hypothetical protein
MGHKDEIPKIFTDWIRDLKRQQENPIALAPMPIHAEKWSLSPRHDDTIFRRCKELGVKFPDCRISADVCDGFIRLKVYPRDSAPSQARMQ